MMANKEIADGVWLVGSEDTRLKDGKWVSDGGAYLVADQSKLSSIPDAHPGDMAMTAGFGHVWQLDTDGVTWVESSATTPGSDAEAAAESAEEAAASAAAAAGSAEAAAGSAQAAQEAVGSILTEQKSTNLIDLSGAIEAKYFDANKGTLANYTNRPVISVYVPLDGAGTYATKVSAQLYGTNAKKLALFDSSKHYVATVTGTMATTPANDKKRVTLVFTVTDANITAGAAYFGLSIETPYAGTIMAVKADAYPDEFEPPYEQQVLEGLTVAAGQAPAYTPNPLYHKIAIFDGDSICNASADNSGKGSYAGRIATNNSMGIRNYAIGGGTLTRGLTYDGGGNRHWVTAAIEEMKDAFPDADYVIFEGGTNDADLIGDITGGSEPEAFGSWTEGDFSGSYNDSTFCGAVEAICYKAVTYWPHSKIGFVIAMKMGTNASKFANRRAYFQTIMDICKKWGVPYINLWDECPMNPNLLSCYDPDADNIAAGKLYKDGQHPTPAGYDRITPMIEAWMRTL